MDSFGYPAAYISSFQTKNYRPINGLEWFVMILSVILLVGIVSWGFLFQNNYNRDRQRQHDIEAQIVPALENFYQNSSTVESKRFYPKSVCSGDLNEVDYELTLRQHLDGSLPEIENHVFIPANLWPRDRSGVYSRTFSQRQIPYRCPNILNFDTIEKNAEIYKDFPSCNFNLAKSLKQCYLYTSTSSGDEFRVAYFSENASCFEVFRKFRSQNLQTERKC